MPSELNNQYQRLIADSDIAARNMAERLARPSEGAGDLTHEQTQAHQQLQARLIGLINPHLSARLQSRFTSQRGEMSRLEMGDNSDQTLGRHASLCKEHEKDIAEFIAGNQDPDSGTTSLAHKVLNNADVLRLFRTLNDINDDEEAKRKLTEEFNNAMTAYQAAVLQQQQQLHQAQHSAIAQEFEDEPRIRNAADVYARYQQGSDQPDVVVADAKVALKLPPGKYRTGKGLFDTSFTVKEVTERNPVTGEIETLTKINFNPHKKAQREAVIDILAAHWKPSDGPVTITIGAEVMAVGGNPYAGLNPGNSDQGRRYAMHMKARSCGIDYAYNGGDWSQYVAGDPNMLLHRPKYSAEEIRQRYDETGEILYQDAYQHVVKNPDQQVMDIKIADFELSPNEQKALEEHIEIRKVMKNIRQLELAKAPSHTSGEKVFDKVGQRPDVPEAEDETPTPPRSIRVR